MLQVKKRAIRHQRKARGYYHLHRSLRPLAHPIDNLSVSFSDCHSTVPARLVTEFLMYLDTQGEREIALMVYKSLFFLKCTRAKARQKNNRAPAAQVRLLEAKRFE